MFCLQLKRMGTKGRQVIKHVHSFASVQRPILHPSSIFQLLNTPTPHPNLKIIHRNGSLNVFGVCIRRFTRMDERLRKIRNSKSVYLEQAKKTDKFRPPKPPPQIAISKEPRKLNLENVKRSILGHLNKDSKFVPLKSLQKVSVNRNVADKQVKLASTFKEPIVENGENESQTKTRQLQDFQRMVLNSPAHNPKKYQVSETLPRMSPTMLQEFDHQAWDKRVIIDSAPKELLHSYLRQVAAHFKSHSYLLGSPDFIETKNGIWSCIYSLVWPQPINFMGQGVSKKDASHNCAKQALVWLNSNNFMNDVGKPIYGKSEPIRSAILRNTQTKGIFENSSSAPTQIRLYSTSSRVDINANFVNPPSEEVLPQNDKDVKAPPNEQVSLQTNAKDMKLARTLYPTPKNTLHNYFHIVSQELKQKDLAITPHYTNIKLKKYSSWTCTYNLKWPELIKFSSSAPTKQEASYKAALTTLAWLLQNAKISKDGRPLIYDKKEVKKITKKNYPVMMFDRFVEEKMNEIVYLYKNDLVRQLATDLGQHDRLESVELDEKWPQAVESYRNGQTFMGLTNQFYEAKEPIKLPISDYRMEIIDLLQNNRVLIVKGEPGCGKSTRVPQYVLEAWAKAGAEDGQPCRIVVTQPRRIAAISLAERVSNEREESVGNTVGYHVRLKSNFNRQTGRIMYCTTGILLRRVQSDPKLSDCSHIILDEAHERDVNTDLLMNLTRHALELNPNLKVLVMSATMEAKVFQDYFGNAPVLHIPGFTYPVKEHFLNENTMPKTYQMCAGQFPNVVHEEVVKQIGNIHKNKPEGAILCFLPGWDDILKVKDLIPKRGDISVLCLHSRLQMSEQKLIFSRPPPGVRKIILATNIAETSITIDDVVYVLDTGIHKEERFDAEKGVNCIDNHWISQASATQRKGRAGRCQAGECFHLYPESKYEQFEKYSIPEILRTSLTKIVLDSKVYSNNMNAVQFLEQLVCPPDNSTIEKAVEELIELELLDENENLTPLGRTLSEFQLPPKLSKAMVNAVIFKCVTPVIDITTLFSADSALFAKSLGGQLEVKDVKSKFSKTSDHLSLMRMFEMWLEFIENDDFHAASNFCEDTGLVQPKLHNLRKLRTIHFDYLRKGLKKAYHLADDFSDNDELVKAVLLSGVGTVLQHRTWDFVKGLLKKTNVLVTRHNQKATITSESVNTRRGKFPSDFLLHINETISNLRHTTLVRESSIISPLTVLLFKKGELEIEELSKENYSEKLKSDDQIILKLQGTKIGFFCDRKQAEALKNCKEALRACVEYYIYQLTKGGENNESINFHWNEMLRNLDAILVRQNVEKN